MVGPGRHRSRRHRCHLGRQGRPSRGDRSEHGGQADGRHQRLRADCGFGSIDGNEVGSFTKEQLAEGIDLALLPTPMARQAAEVHKLTVQHNNLHFARWRQFQVPAAGQKSPRVQTALQSLLAAFDADEADVIKQQRDAAQPTPHKYELVAQ